MTIFEYFLGAVLGSLPEYFLSISGVFFGDLRKSSKPYFLVFSEYFSGTPENSRNCIFWSIFEEFSILHNLAELPQCKTRVFPPASTGWATDVVEGGDFKTSMGF